MTFYLEELDAAYAALRSRLRAGDPAAREELICRIRSDVAGLSRSFVQGITGGESYTSRPHTQLEEQDLCQEILTRIYKNVGSFKELAPFKFWVYSLARNIFIDWLRRRDPIDRASSFENSEAMDEEVCPTPKVWEDREAELDVRGELRKLNQALARLSPVEVRVVQLRVAGCTFGDISRILAEEGEVDLKPAGVKSKYHRAIKELKKTLKKS